MGDTGWCGHGSLERGAGLGGGLVRMQNPSAEPQWGAASCRWRWQWGQELQPAAGAGAGPGRGLPAPSPSWCLRLARELRARGLLFTSLTYFWALICEGPWRVPTLPGGHHCLRHKSEAAPDASLPRAPPWAACPPRLPGLGGGWGRAWVRWALPAPGKWSSLRPAGA